MDNLKEYINDEKIQTCFNKHDIECNQTYGGSLKLPYSFHLKCVMSNAVKYKKYIADYSFYKVILGCAGHDLIEDARMTYNDIKELLGEVAANIVYACTEEKGRNRAERHSQKFFDELKENRLAVFVKLCDILANATFSRLTNSGMWYKYKKEFSNLIHQLYVKDEYEDLWNELEIILDI